MPLFSFLPKIWFLCPNCFEDIRTTFQVHKGLSWSWSYGSWIYNYLCNECESRSGEVYSVQHYVIKLVSDLQLISGFLRVLRFLPPIKLTCHDKTEILLKVALDTITITRFHFIAKYSFGTVKYLNTPNIRVFFFFTHCRWWNS